jgi:hypothetical protein
MPKLVELIELASKESPAAFVGIDPRTATKVLRAVLTTIATEVEKSSDGAYKVPGLGVFRIRTVEEGAEGKRGGRRVMFVTPKPKAPAEK